MLLHIILFYVDFFYDNSENLQMAIQPNSLASVDFK